ncbi:hypothetical protein [Spirosoma telluris]|uniref:hypothetical protein n=1 Tax=Spirosoma telluris TaxID=2183553 RepID=UPI002FC2788C
MKHLFTLLLLGVGATCALAQAVNSGKLTGSLTDSTTTKPVPFATVALMDGPKLITGTTTDGLARSYYLAYPWVPIGWFCHLLDTAPKVYPYHSQRSGFPSNWALF